MKPARNFAYSCLFLTLLHSLSLAFSSSTEASDVQQQGMYFVEHPVDRILGKSDLNVRVECTAFGATKISIRLHHLFPSLDFSNFTPGIFLVKFY